MSNSKQLARLRDGLEQLGQDPDRFPCDGYLAYLELLCRWNRAYNLTAIREPESMLTHHLLDSLALLPYIQGPRCLDAGTGAGLPGLVLALARPAQQWILLDGNSKKVRFLNQVLLELKPANVGLIHDRVENYRPSQVFSTVVCRAFTSLHEFHRRAKHLLAENGRMLAMKGRQPVAEIAELETAGLAYTLHELSVPGVDAQRCVVVMGGGIC